MIIKTLYGHTAQSRVHSTSALIPLLLNCPQRAPSVLSRRHYSPRTKPRAPTTAPEAVPKTPSPVSPIPGEQHLDPINPPPSTRPPPLEVPDTNPAISKLSNLIATGKAYLRFYKSGLKNTWRNWRALDAVRDRHNIRSTHSNSLFQAVTSPGSTFSRSDYQLLRRGSRDVRRLLPFGVVLAICGEFTPFVVLFMSSVVPKICWIPAQVLADKKKWEDRRKTSFRNLAEVHSAAEARDKAYAMAAKAREEGKDLKEATDLLKKLSAKPPPPPHMAPTGSQPLTLIEVKHMLVSLRLMPPFLVNGLTGPIGLRRLQRYTKYLVLDDMLIQRGGGVAALNDEELVIAAEERGLDTLGVQTDVLRRRVQEWVDEVLEKCKSSYHDGWVTMGEMLVTRPEEWVELRDEDKRRSEAESRVNMPA
jgi:hypothetical protein